jgi:hypothetical protein
MKNREENFLKRLNDETVKEIEDKAATYFEKRDYALPFCSRCHRKRMTTRCNYPLHGSKEGQICGKILCEDCVNMINNRPYCRPHAKMVKENA